MKTRSTFNSNQAVLSWWFGFGLEPLALLEANDLRTTLGTPPNRAPRQWWAFFPGVSL